MNIAIWRRLVWKELRLQLPIVLLLAALAVLLAFILTNAISNPWERDTRLVFMLYAVMAIAMSTTGSTLFASERELQTLRLLNSLPVNGNQLIVGKASSAVISLFVMLIALGLTAHFSLDWRWWYIEWETSQVAAHLLVVSLEFLAWSCLISLLVNRVITALLGGLAIGGLASAVWRMATTTFERAPLERITGFLTELGWLWPRWMLALALLAGVTWYALRWAENSNPGVYQVRDFLRARTRRTSSSGEHRGFRSKWTALFWSTTRNSKWTWAMAILTVVASGGLFLSSVILGYAELQSNMPIIWGLAALTASPGLILGAFVFSADHQQNGFEFLTGRGAATSRLWISRIGPWFAIAMFCHALTTLFFAGAFSSIWSPLLGSRMLINEQVHEGQILFSQSNGRLLTLDSPTAYLISWLLLGWNAFGVAAFCSINFRSTVVAGLMSLLLIPFLIAWSLYSAWANLPMWWASFPIGLMALAGSYNGLYGQLNCKRRLQDAFMPWLIVGCATVVIVAATAAYRVYEIPYTTIPSHYRDFDSEVHKRELRGLLAATSNALSFLDNDVRLPQGVTSIEARPTSLDSPVHEKRRAFFSDHQEYIAALRDCDRLNRRLIELCDRVHPYWLLDEIIRGKLVATGARPGHGTNEFLHQWFEFEMTEGNLERVEEIIQIAWNHERAKWLFEGRFDLTSADRSCPWLLWNKYLAHPEHNAMSLANAKQNLEREFQAYLTPWADQSCYVVASSLRALHSNAIGPDQKRVQWSELLNLFPWERARSLRWIRWFAVESVNRDLQRVAYAPGWNWGAVDAGYRDIIRQLALPHENQWPARMEALMMTTIPVNQIRKNHSSRSFSREYSSIGYYTYRRDQTALLALIAIREFQLERGRFPHLLQEIPEGRVFSDPHSDAYWRKEISYWPSGLTWTRQLDFNEFETSAWSCSTSKLAVVAAPPRDISFQHVTYLSELKVQNTLTAGWTNPRDGSTARKFYLPTPIDPSAGTR